MHEIIREYPILSIKDDLMKVTALENSLFLVNLGVFSARLDGATLITFNGITLSVEAWCDRMQPNPPLNQGA